MRKGPERTVASIGENLRAVLNPLPAHVSLVAVSKTFDADAVREAYAAGQRDFGENKVQELRSKAEACADLPGIRWHFIGHLQSNKVKDVLRVANLVMIHSVDRLKIAEMLNQQLSIENRRLEVLIQVNVSGEESKYGCAPEDTGYLVRAIAALPQLRIKGFMTIGKLGGTPWQTRQCFRSLRQVAAEITEAKIPSVGTQVLSMGMTSDFGIALEEGSTLIRVGQAIFGQRQTRDTYYWPEAKS